MKDVIDVMQLQREKSRQVPAIDYTETENSFIAVRYIFECGKDRNCYGMYKMCETYTAMIGWEIHVKF
jgi:hypothetical protein